VKNPRSSHFRRGRVDSIKSICEGRNKLKISAQASNRTPAALLGSAERCWIALSGRGNCGHASIFAPALPAAGIPYTLNPERFANLPELFC
jgi:hypothetical protein